MSDLDKFLEEDTKEDDEEIVECEPVNVTSEYETDGNITEDVRKKFRVKLSKGARRKEKKRIMNGEVNQLVDSRKFFLYIFAISIFILTMLFTSFPAGQQNEGIRSIILIVGIMLFIPIGIIVGWVLLDPVMRCKLARKATRKNFGLIYFVAKGKKMFPRMKNFDNDLIFIKNKCWSITRSGIYEVDDEGDRITHKKVLDPDGVVTLSETVPVVFIDMKSIEPLVFDTKDRERIAPEELSSFLKGWTDNQLAKIMFLKKTLDIYFIIVIVSAMASAFFGYQNYVALEDMQEEIEAIKTVLDNMVIQFW